MMFNSRYVDPLMREKEYAARSQPLRGRFHSHTPPARAPSHNAYSSRTPGGGWDGPYSGHGPSEKRRFGGDVPNPWPSMCPSGRAFGRGNTTTTRSAAYNDRRISFEQAIADMIFALEYANDGLHELEQKFTHDIASLRLWLPAQHIESLWTIYTGWNGIPATTKHPENSKLDANSETTAKSAPTFAEVVMSMSKALTGLKHCLPPDELELGLGNGDHGPGNDYYANSGLGWHVLTTTMRKLEISFEAINELIALVRMHRDRLPALKHEITAALQCMEGMRPLIEHAPRKSRGKATVRETGKREEGEHDLPYYGSI